MKTGYVIPSSTLHYQQFKSDLSEITENGNKAYL